MRSARLGAMAAMFGALGASVGSVRYKSRRYTHCWKCGNKTREEGLCHKCYLIVKGDVLTKEDRSANEDEIVQRCREKFGKSIMKFGRRPTGQPDLLVTDKDGKTTGIIIAPYQPIHYTEDVNGLPFQVKI